MAKIQLHKVSQLPITLAPNALYFVKRLDGFDLYTTSTTGEPIKLNDGIYRNSSIGILLNNNSSKQITLGVKLPDIDDEIVIKYRAKRGVLFETGLLKIISSQTTIYREAEFSDCGLTFSTSMNIDNIILNVTDEISDGNNTIINFDIEIKPIKL